MSQARVRPGYWTLAIAVSAFAAGYGFRALTEGARAGGRPAERAELGSARGAPAEGGEIGSPPGRGSRGGDFAQARGAGRRDLERSEPGGRERPKGPKGESPPEGRENPFAGRPRAEVEEALRDALSSGDRERFWLAAKAMGPLAPPEVARFAEWALASGDPATVEMVTRMLVRNGGSEGIAAVARIAGDPNLELKARGVAIEALADSPPERLVEARDALLGVIGSGLPGKLESHAVHAYGRTFEDRAVEGLAGLLEAGGVRREAVFHAMRDFARAEDIPLLSGLLEASSAREEQEILLRALGSAAGAKGGELLLGLLENPPAGLRRDAIGFALEEFARKEDVPELWKRLETETQRPVQAALARALARAGGAEEVSKLVELAAAPDSSLSLDMIAGALAKNARAENVPLLESALERVRTWEAAEALASEIIRLSGKDGAARVLAIAGRVGGDEGRRAMIEVVERFGDASSAEALASLLERETDHGVVFHLAKALMRLDPAYGPDALAERIGTFSNGDQRAAIADFLERQGNPSIIPALAKALRAEEFGRAQWHLARAMAALGPSGVETLVGAILEDPNPARRAEALRGFESAAPEAAAELARSLLGDERLEVRRAAVDVLGRRGGERAREELAAYLARETDPKLREAIRRALAPK